MGFRSTLSAIAVLGATFGLASVATAQNGSFQFGLMGDTGYSAKGIEEFRNLVAAINQQELAFVIHIGDFEADGGAFSQSPSGPMPCTTESYQRNLNLFQSIRHPFVLTPGDNDWTDCGKIKATKFDPVEQLSIIRGMFFPEGVSLGQKKMPVESQSRDPQFAKFRENLRWSMGGVLFATLHITGSNDNLTGDPAMDAEHRERKAANIAWMKATFAKAKAEGGKGIVFMTQANPGFENYWPPAAKGRYFGPFVGRSSPPPKPASAFDDYVSELSDQLETYDKPVAYLHGDTHLHRIDKPVYSKKTNRAFENFTRVETYGDPDSHWVRVTVNPDDPLLFTFRGEFVSANRANHK